MSREAHTVLMPTQVSTRVGFFDRFAGLASLVAGRAAFFAFCVLLIVVWAPSILFLRDVDTWQLIINTATTIITFLMVALLQNSQTRNDQALHHKLNAIADGLSDLMVQIESGLPDRDLSRDVTELRAAIGLEEHESTSHNASSAPSPAIHRNDKNSNGRSAGPDRPAVRS
jgi:low affinity Fe/Cu permease